MGTTKISFVIILFCLIKHSITGNSYRLNNMMKTHCLNPPRTARRVQNVITECQKDVKNKLVTEAYELLNLQRSAGKDPSSISIHGRKFVLIENFSDNSRLQRHATNDSFDMLPLHSSWILPVRYKYFFFKEVNYPTSEMSRLIHHIRRVSDLSEGIYQPTLVAPDDKRIAGCLLHCVYAKNNAIDKFGWPAQDGLVHFYSEGVNVHGFFMAALRSVNLCLRAATTKYQVNRRKQSEEGENCDLAFDVFDCISEKITEFCLAQFKH